MKNYALIGLIVLAAACAKKDPSISLMTEAEATTMTGEDSRSLVPADAAKPGFFGRIFGGTPEEPAVVQTEEQEFLAETGATVELAAATSVPAPRKGFFGRVFGKKETVQPLVAAAPPIEISMDAAIDLAVAEAEEPPKKGFFGRLFGGSNAASEDGAEIVEASATKPVVENRETGGERTASVNDAPLPPGVIAKVCRFSKRRLGTEVKEAAGFKLYDSDPETFAPRSHFVTGFKDGCARKFTAGMAFLGDPLLHETKRYKSRAEYSDLDEAYETVKARICRVAKRAHCEKRTKQLVDTTVFVSIYSYFGNANSSGEILLHKGRIKASDFDI